MTQYPWERPVEPEEPVSAPIGSPSDPAGATEPEGTPEPGSGAGEPPEATPPAPAQEPVFEVPAWVQTDAPTTESETVEAEVVDTGTAKPEQLAPQEWPAHFGSSAGSCGHTWHWARSASRRVRR